MENICSDCDFSLDRPAYGCMKVGHREPDLAERIVASIEDDLTDRRGLRQEWDRFDSEIIEEIRDEWAARVRDLLKENS